MNSNSDNNKPKNSLIMTDERTIEHYKFVNELNRLSRLVRNNNKQPDKAILEIELKIVDVEYTIFLIEGCIPDAELEEDNIFLIESLLQSSAAEILKIWRSFTIIALGVISRGGSINSNSDNNKQPDKTNDNQSNDFSSPCANKNANINKDLSENNSTLSKNNYPFSEAQRLEIIKKFKSLQDYTTPSSEEELKLSENNNSTLLSKFGKEKLLDKGLRYIMEKDRENKIRRLLIESRELFDKEPREIMEMEDGKNKMIDGEFNDNSTFLATYSEPLSNERLYQIIAIDLLDKMKIGCRYNNNWLLSFYSKEPLPEKRRSDIMEIDCKKNLKRTIKRIREMILKKKSTSKDGRSRSPSGEKVSNSNANIALNNPPRLVSGLNQNEYDSQLKKPDLEPLKKKGKYPFPGFRVIKIKRELSLFKKKITKTIRKPFIFRQKEDTGLPRHFTPAAQE